MSYDARETSQYGGQPIECYRFVQGLNTYLFTSADQPMALPSGTYNPEVVTRTEIDLSQEQSAGNTEVSLPRDNAVSLLFVAYLPVTPVSLTIFRKHRSDSDVLPIFIGKVMNGKFTGPQCTLTCAPLSHIYKKQIPLVVYQSQCNLALYSPRCGVDKNLFKVSGAVSSVSLATLHIPTLAAKPDGYFSNGWVERDDGNVRFILSHVGSVLTLVSPFPNLMAGETVSAFAGCQRTEAVCSGKFGNLANHLGFARIPTVNPYNSGLL